MLDPLRNNPIHDREKVFRLDWNLVQDAGGIQNDAEQQTTNES